MYISTHTHNIHISTHTHNIHRILIIKKNEILPFAAKLMDLEGITLSEISPTEEYKHYDKTYM